MGWVASVAVEGAAGFGGTALPAVRSVTPPSLPWRTRAPHLGHLSFRPANLSSTLQADLHDGQLNWITNPFYPGTRRAWRVDNIKRGSFCFWVGATRGPAFG